MTPHQKSLSFSPDSHIQDRVDNKQLLCQQCGYLWFKRVQGIPVRCPSCERFTWNKPKQEVSLAVRFKPQAHDLTGRNFGRWTVLERAQKAPSGVTKWLCKCDCGTIKSVITHTLTSGNSQSCGCKFQEMVAVRRLRPYERLYRQLVRCSAERKIYLDISYEQFLVFTETKECHYCEALIPWNEFGGPSGTTGYYLDRRDPTLGYSIYNCDVCCTRCNRGKLDLFSYEEWVEIGKVIRSWSQR